MVFEESDKLNSNGVSVAKIESGRKLLPSELQFDAIEVVLSLCLTPQLQFGAFVCLATKDILILWIRQVCPFMASLFYK